MFERDPHVIDAFSCVSVSGEGWSVKGHVSFINFSDVGRFAKTKSTMLQSFISFKHHKVIIAASNYVYSDLGDISVTFCREPSSGSVF